MNGQLTCLSEFRFDSLRKFMQPVYAGLNLHSHDTKEEKQTVLPALVSQFFRRLRIYREIPIEMVAERANLPVEDLEKFEAGVLKSNPAIEYAYCRACSGLQEREFFERRIYEFIHPTVRASKEAIAMDALKRFGVVMPDVDYAGLNTPKGVLLSFPAK
jgi:hypothetical protein